MGVKLPGILPMKTIDWVDLKNKKIAIDASNMLYQFLSTIRQKDGTLLMDSQSRVTSHLSGTFYRMSNLMQKGISVCVCFDGEPSELKYKTQQQRRERKEKAREKYKAAKKEEDIESMYKYSKQVVYLSDDMIKETKELLKAMGIPVIQAPQEADAQISFITEKKDVDFAASSDMDCLLHSCPKLIPNLTLSQTRNLPGGKFVYIKPYVIELKEVLKHLDINQDQLIVIGILTGTDYNPKGVLGIGPKTALKLVHQYKDFDTLFKEVKADFNWKQIFAIFKSMPIMKNYQLKWTAPNPDKIREILVEEHDFNEERVNNTIEKITNRDMQQEGLNKFIN